MFKNFVILDERKVWHGPAVKAAKDRHYTATRVRRGDEAEAQRGLGFIRPHAEPTTLRMNQRYDYPAMAGALVMVQDRAQVEVYENKSEQFRRWAGWMPRTWRFTDLQSALQFIESSDRPSVLVGKADVGASSTNVHVLANRDQMADYLDRVFGAGIVVDHCAGPSHRARSLQKGYVLLQEFIPHDFTYRLNIVGRCLAGFRRFNYADRPVAQTGNVEPMHGIQDELLNFAYTFFNAIGTKWCAADILWDAANSRYRVLETSLAWPWPSPGDCMDAPFFGDTRRKWAEIWDLMLDEYEAGVWGFDT